MSQVTLAPNESHDITPKTQLETQVKITNSNSSDGRIQIECPNVSADTKDIAALSEKHIQIPIGTTRFTNKGSVSLSLTWG